MLQAHAPQANMLSSKILTAKLIVAIWVLGFAGSLIIQTVLQFWFGSVTLWGRSAWQNEIAIWNFTVILILTPLLWSEEMCRRVVPGLTIGSICFGTNHAWAILAAQKVEVGNVVGAVANGVAVILGCLYFHRRKSK